MSRVHDMGGRFGDGPVTPAQADDPAFEADWHKRALALTLASGSLGQWNIDISRHAREGLPPKTYAGYSYYEKWLGALADMLVATGVVTRQELEGGKADGPGALADRALKAEAVAAVLAKGGPADRASDVTPRFQPGDAVRSRAAGNTLVDGGHTRLPAYAAKAQGRVVLYHGTHILPDSNAHGLGEAPEPLYAVAFAASELWLTPEHPNDEVILDLWQSYLEPAD